MDSRDNGFKGNPATNFTQSLFTAKVFGTDENTQVKEGYMPIAEQNTANGAYNVDAQLRTLTQTAYDGISLSAFPSDEEVFAAIRADGGYSITIDGKSIPAQNLTTDYFKVRWYVLKYHDSDGWHIDGVLVAKQAQLRVTNPFSATRMRSHRSKPDGQRGLSDSDGQRSSAGRTGSCRRHLLSDA